MTEIPEHLLKRSRERRSAMGGAPEGGDTPAPSQAVEAAASSTPAVAAPAAPVAKPEPVVVPDPPYVTAAKQRPRIPSWAMATLSLLPIFMFMYWRGLTTEETVVEGPIGAGAEIFSSNCSGCHGAAGEGGVGRQLDNGEVLKTFPADHINDQLNFIYVGTQGFIDAGLPFYGNPDREGGTHLTYNGALMPAQGSSLSELEILEVACYIRYELGGADETGEYATEYEEWCSPEAPNFIGFEDGSLTFDTEALAITKVARPMVSSTPE